MHLVIHNVLKFDWKHQTKKKKSQIRNFTLKKFADDRFFEFEYKLVLGRVYYTKKCKKEKKNSV